MLILHEMKKSLRSLLMHRLRTLLSTLGVLFGVVAVIAMLSIGEGAKQETLEQIEQLGMNNIIIRQNALSDDQKAQAFENSSKGLSWEDVEAMNLNIPMLQRYAPLKVIEASLSGSLTQSSPEILAVTRSFSAIKNLELAEGRLLCDLDQQGRKQVCVLGYEVAKSLGMEGHAGRSLRIENVHFEIVGVLKSKHWKAGKNSSIATRNLDKIILIPLGSETNLPSSPKKNAAFSEVVLQIGHHQQLGIAAQLLKNLLERMHGGYEDYQIVIPQELLQQAYRTQRTFNLVLGSIAAISMLVGGIGIMNIMLATVSERTREIGIRRAVGANKRHILIQFISETLLLTLVGALLGIVIGIVFSLGISYIAGWKTIVTFWSICLALIMSLMVGVCSGIYPAFQASSMDPIRALRHD